MTTIKCKSAQTGLVYNEKPVIRFFVVHNGIAYEDAVYEAVSMKTGIPVSMLKAMGTLLFEQIMEELRHGRRVELPQISAYLTLPGNVESVSAESRRKSPPVPTVNLVAKGAFKKCCQGEDFVIENITKGATVVVDGVIGTNQVPDVLLNGQNVEVHVTGRGLYMPDVSDPAVGVYLADNGGKVLAMAEVTESTVVSVVCTFPQINLEEGTYKFCVTSRNGLDPAQYGVTIASRNVRVVNAASAEEGV